MPRAHAARRGRDSATRDGREGDGGEDAARRGDTEGERSGASGSRDARVEVRGPGSKNGDMTGAHAAGRATGGGTRDGREMANDAGESTRAREEGGGDQEKSDSESARATGPAGAADEEAGRPRRNTWPGTTWGDPDCREGRDREEVGPVERAAATRAPDGANRRGTAATVAGKRRQRPRRATATVGGGRGYDEATRRAKRKKRTEGTTQARYVERRKRMWGGDIKRGIEVGPLTVERVVGARYEWRDAAYAARSGASAVIWLGSQVWDPGR